MIKPNCFFSLALVAASFVFAGDAHAEQSYEFAFEQPDYTVVEGSTVDIRFFLRETATNGDTARLEIGGEDGIFGFGVNADFSSFSGGAAGSTVASTADVAIEAIFDDPGATNAALAGSSVDIAGVTSDSDGIEIAETSPDVYELTLATITVTAGDVGSVTTFSLSDHTNTAVLSLFGDGFSIDSVATYGSTNVTVIAAIPEPSSVLILAGIAGMSLLRRRRR